MLSSFSCSDMRKGFMNKGLDSCCSLITWSTPPLTGGHASIGLKTSINSSFIFSTTSGATRPSSWPATMLTHVMSWPTNQGAGIVPRIPTYEAFDLHESGWCITLSIMSPSHTSNQAKLQHSLLSLPRFTLCYSHGGLMLGVKEIIAYKLPKSCNIQESARIRYLLKAEEIGTICCMGVLLAPGVVVWWCR